MDRYTSNEAGVMRLLREMLVHERFAELYELPQILRYEEEFHLSRGRCDFVLFHADGSTTVVEAKAAGDVRAIVGGIGQLLSYTIQIGMARRQGVVRGLLIAPVKPATMESRLIDEACYRAGMRFEPCPFPADLSENARRLEAEFIKDQKHE